jgi:hypothetical protein
LKNFFFVLLAAVLFLVMGLGLVIPVVNLGLKNEEVRSSLVRYLASSLDGTLETASLAVSLDRRQLRVSGKNIQGHLLDNTLDLDIPSLDIRIRYSDLLQASFFPDVVEATSPRIHYTPRGEDGFRFGKTGNWAGEINDLLENIFGHGSKMNISDATVVTGGIRLEKLHITSSQQNYQTSLEITADLGFGEAHIPLKINGFTVNPFAAPFSSAFTVEARNIPLELLPGSRDFFFSGGVVDFSGKLHGEGDEISLAGKCVINYLDMTVGWTSEDGTNHQEKPYQLQHLVLDLQGGLNKRTFNFPTLDLQSDDFRLSGSFLFDFTRLSNPSMELRLQSDEMELATLKMLLPDPLINDWTTQTIFPRLENGTAVINSLVLAGPLRELALLDDPRYAHGLSWSGVLRNVDTFYNDHKKLARVERTRLSMDGDVLKVENMQAKAGKSVLRRGDLTLSGLYDPAMKLTVDIDGSFEADWLLSLTRAGLAGEELQQLAPAAAGFSGRIGGRFSFASEIGKDIILESVQGKGTIEKARMSAKKTILPLRLDTSTFSVVYPGVSTVKGKGKWGKSPFSAVLKLTDLDKKQQLRLSGRPDLAELKKIFFADSSLTALAPCIASLPVTADISLEKSGISAKGSIDFSAPAASDNSLVCSQVIAANTLKKSSFQVRIKGPRTEIKKFTLVTPQGSAEFSARLQQQRKKPVALQKVRLKAKSFPLPALELLLPKYNTWLLGNMDADLSAETLDPADFWQDISGRATLKGWHGKVDYPQINVTSMDLEAAVEQGRVLLHGRNILLKDITMDKPIRLQANLGREKQGKKKVWNGVIRLHAAMLDMSDFPSLYRHGKTDNPINLPIGNITLLAGVDHAWYNNLVFSPFYLQGEATAERIYISQSVIKLNESFIWLSGKLKRKTNEVSYESYFKIRGQPVETFLKLYGFEHDKISGMLDLEGKLVARVTPGETVFENSRGAIFFEITNGIIKSSSALVKILDLLSLENILDKKDVLSSRNRFKFNLIQGRFDLDGGVFTTDSLLMDAPVFDLFAEGTVDIPRQYIEMQVKLAPFGTISKIFSSIPFFGYVFTGKTRSLVDYSLSVKGKLGDPVVRYVPLAGTFDSLTGYLKRLVSRKEEVKKKVNNAAAENLERQRNFIGFMQRELSSLHGGGGERGKR